MIQPRSAGRVVDAPSYYYFFKEKSYLVSLTDMHHRRLYGDTEVSSIIKTGKSNHEEN